MALSYHPSYCEGVDVTHDELLAIIDQIQMGAIEHQEVCDKLPLAYDSIKALRAVVELHKPYKYEGLDIHDEPITSFHCMQCGRPYLYPCETIKAIEKELK